MSNTKNPAPAIETNDTVTEAADYASVLKSLRAGEKLQLLTKLNVEEVALARTGTAQLVAVAWKHRKTTTGQVKVTDLLDMTDEELLDVLGLTPEAYIEQIKAMFEDGDDTKSGD